MSEQKQITQTLYFVKWDNDDEMELSNVNSTIGGGRVVLGSTEVTVDVPDDLRDPVDAQIECLTTERDRILAEAGAKADNIKEQISRLQAISYQKAES